MTTDNALSARFAQLQSSTVGDVLDELGYRDQVLDSALSPIALSMRVAGPAFTIQGITRPEHHSDIKPKPGYEMFRHMYDGCVAVMDTGGHSIAGPWGENTALSARMRGCQGVVIDGGTRDAAELVEMGFPAFTRFVTPARVENRWVHIGFQLPITMPGQAGREVTVHPGDIVVADADGVVIVPQELAPRVASGAEEVTRIETKIRRELQQGLDREDIYTRNDRYRHLHETT